MSTVGRTQPTQPKVVKPLDENHNPNATPVMKVRNGLPTPRDPAAAKAYFDRHFKTPDGRAKCHLCQASNTLDERIKAHIKATRSEDKCYDCPLLNCEHTDGTPHRTTQVENTASHVKTILGIIDLKCKVPTCNKTFSDTSRRSKHMSAAHKNHPSVVNRAPRRPRAQSSKTSSRKRSLSTTDSDTDNAPPRKMARKSLAKRTARENEVFVDVPEAGRRAAHVVDDQPVAGPSSGPAFDRLASHPPSSSRIHNTRPTTSTTGASHGPSFDFDPYLPLDDDEEWLYQPSSSYPEYPFDSVDDALLYAGPEYTDNYGYVQVEDVPVFLPQPYPAAGFFQLAPEVVQPPSYHQLYSGFDVGAVLEPWEASYPQIDIHLPHWPAADDPIYNWADYGQLDWQ